MAETKHLQRKLCQVQSFWLCRSKPTSDRVTDSHESKHRERKIQSSPFRADVSVDGGRVSEDGHRILYLFGLIETQPTYNVRDAGMKSNGLVLCAYHKYPRKGYIFKLKNRNLEPERFNFMGLFLRFMY